MARNIRVFTKMVIQFTINLACRLLKILLVSFLRSASRPRLITLLLLGRESVQSNSSFQIDFLR